MSKDNYCPSQDWDRYCNHYDCPEPTWLDKLLTVLGFYFSFTTRKSSSFDFKTKNDIKTQVLKFYLFWGYINFDLTIIDNKLSSFHFSLSSPYYGLGDNSPDLISVSIWDDFIYYYKDGNKNKKYKIIITTLKERLDKPIIDEFGYGIYSTFNHYIYRF